MFTIFRSKNCIWTTTKWIAPYTGLCWATDWKVLQKILFCAVFPVIILKKKKLLCGAFFLNLISQLKIYGCLNLFPVFCSTEPLMCTVVIVCDFYKVMARFRFLDDRFLYIKKIVRIWNLLQVFRMDLFWYERKNEKNEGMM